MIELEKSKPEIKQPNVFEYEDVGSFLKDWLNFQKLHKKNSLRRLTKESDVSVGSLSMALNGKRRLTTKALQKLLDNLKLNQQERRFLELLHTVEDSESPVVRVDALCEMARLSSYKKTNQKEHNTVTYLTKWFHVAIREMVLLPDFKEDPVWIQKRLRGRIGLNEVNEALEFLVNGGYINRDANGKMTLPEIDLQCKEGIYRISLAEFHRQVLEMAHKSIHDVDRDQRYILGRTVSISSSEFKQAKEIFDEALRKIEALGQQKASSKEVYHFELAAFPMTEKKDD
ncbi:MAG: DUF4423 domain-containing protein [Bdellovibrio sp.]